MKSKERPLSQQKWEGGLCIDGGRRHHLWGLFFMSVLSSVHRNAGDMVELALPGLQVFFYFLYHTKL